MTKTRGKMGVLNPGGLQEDRDAKRDGYGGVQTEMERDYEEG